MQHALVNGVKREAKPKSQGACICCGNEMIAKCGIKMIWHWAHKSKNDCDTWRENETPWHRDWKNLFPVESQEVLCFSEQEKNILLT